MELKRKQTSLSFPKKLVKPTKSVDQFQFEGREIHILSWNVNGLRAWVKKPNTLEFVNRAELDIVCLNETKLQNCHVSQISHYFPGFKYQYWTCSETKLGYSGTAVLSKVKPLSVEYGLKGHPAEGRVVTAEFEKFYVVATYIPNSMSRYQYRVEKWDKDLREYLINLKTKGKGIIWIGDLNVINQDIDVYTLEGNEECAGGTKAERLNLHETLSSGFTDAFRELHPQDRKYSWFNTRRKSAKPNNEGWRFDMSIISDDLKPHLKESLVYDNTAGSDHYPIELMLNNF